MTNIQKFIDELNVEIRQEEDVAKREAELERLQEIARTYTGEDRLVSSLDIAESLKNAPQSTKIMSGYQGLDDILKGFLKQQLTVISALTKSGKTSFCIELTSRFKDLKPMWLPYEESAQELIQKFLDRNEQPPLFYTPKFMADRSLMWVEKKIIEAKAKENAQVVFIDQLDFLVPYTSDNRSDRIGDVMRELKRMAKTWDVLIFLICHLVKTEMTIQPTLEDLKGSSAIGQEADTVILLWRETKRQHGQVIIGNQVNVSVQANRRTGATGNVKMTFKDGHFYEEDWKREDTEEDNW